MADKNHPRPSNGKAKDLDAEFERLSPYAAQLRTIKDRGLLSDIAIRHLNDLYQQIERLAAGEDVPPEIEGQATDKGRVK